MSVTVSHTCIGLIRSSQSLSNKQKPATVFLTNITLKQGTDPWPALGPVGSSGLFPADLDCTALTTDWLSTIALFSALEYCATVPSQWHGQGYNSCIYCVGGSASCICRAVFCSLLYVLTSSTHYQLSYLFLISKARRWPGKIYTWLFVCLVFMS